MRPILALLLLALLASPARAAGPGDEPILSIMQYWYGTRDAPDIARGRAIARLEQMLWLTGHHLQPPTGHESPALTAAMAGFQRRISAPETGILTVKEYGALAGFYTAMLPRRHDWPDAAMLLRSGPRVVAQGSWQGQGADEGDSYPPNSALIFCDRARMACSEAAASLALRGGDLESVRLLWEEWQVESWDKDAITARNTRQACIDARLVIDFASRTTNQTRQPRPLESCDGQPVRDGALTLGQPSPPDEYPLWKLPPALAGQMNPDFFAGIAWLEDAPAAP